MEFSLAQLLQVMILLATGGANGGGYLASKYVLIAMHGGILFLHALINSLNITWLSYVTIIAAAWNVVGECSSLITCISTLPQKEGGGGGGGVMHIFMGYLIDFIIVHGMYIMFSTLYLCNCSMDFCHPIIFFDVALINILQSATSPATNLAP